MLNPPNRRIRTRTYGGVGGEEPRGSPLSRSTSNSPRAALRQANNDPIRTRPAFGWEAGKPVRRSPMMQPTLIELSGRLAAGETTSRALIEESLARIVD